MNITSNVNNNAAGAQGTGTNQAKLYEVTVHRTDYLYTVVRVEAESKDQAETQAETLAGLQPDSEWDVADRDLYAFSAEQVKEGVRTHE
jgi:hypothetical protein